MAWGYLQGRTTSTISLLSLFIPSLTYPPKPPHPLALIAHFYPPTPNSWQPRINFLSLGICLFRTLRTGESYCILWFGTCYCHLAQRFQGSSVSRFCQSLTLFYGWIVFCCLGLHYFVHWFISWWTFELFLLFVYYEQSGCEYPCTNLCVGVCFHFS